MKTNKFKLTTAAMATMLLMSHTVWVESDYKGKVGSNVTLNVYFGEYEKNLREEGDALNSLADFKAMFRKDGKNTPLALAKSTNSYRGSFQAKENGFYELLAINDGREVQDWTKYGLTLLRPIEYQRSAFLAGQPVKKDKSSPAPFHYLDIVPDYLINTGKELTSAYQSGASVRATVYVNNKPFPNQDVSVMFPGKSEPLKLTSDAEGVITFTTTAKGAYLVSGVYNDKTPGKFKDKEYNLIRHHASTTIYCE